MEIRLYKTTDAPEKLNKTLTGELHVNGALRDSNNVLQPYVEMTVDVTQYNYAYIPQYSRYYFVTGYRVVRSGLFAVSLSVDVLMSYREQILEVRGRLANGTNVNPYNSNATYGTEVRQTAHQTKFAYTFEKQDDLILVGLVGR